jgi:hypothetical protein
MRFCARCDGGRWVCEEHPQRPWDGEQPAVSARALVCRGRVGVGQEMTHDRVT